MKNTDADKLKSALDANFNEFHWYGGCMIDYEGSAQNSVIAYVYSHRKEDASSIACNLISNINASCVAYKTITIIRRENDLSGELELSYVVVS